MLVVLALSKNNKRRVSVTISVVLIAVILLNIPSPAAKLDSGKQYRAMFFQLDSDLLESLKADLTVGEVIAFLP